MEWHPPPFPVPFHDEPKLTLRHWQRKAGKNDKAIFSFNSVCGIHWILNGISLSDNDSNDDNKDNDNKDNNGSGKEHHNRDNHYKVNNNNENMKMVFWYCCFYLHTLSGLLAYRLLALY